MLRRGFLFAAFFLFNILELFSVTLLEFKSDREQEETTGKKGSPKKSIS